MALYVAPMHLKHAIEIFLTFHYPGRVIKEQGLSFAEARALVMQTCDDKTLVQPAVKLPSTHDSIRYSAMFGTVLQCNWDFKEMVTADHNTSKFLFSSDGFDRNVLRWVLLELAPPSAQ